MHATDIVDDDGTWTFHFNGDLSGKVRIFAPMVEGQPPSNEEEEPLLEIDADTLVEFVGRVLQNQTIARIESMSGIDFLDWSRELP